MILLLDHHYLELGFDDTIQAVLQSRPYSAVIETLCPLPRFYIPFLYSHPNFHSDQATTYTYYVVLLLIDIGQPLNGMKLYEQRVPGNAPGTILGQG